MTERRRSYAAGLEPLEKIVKEAFRFSSAFYSKHKKIDGKIQEPIDFFKHRDMHKLMNKFYQRSGKHKTNITKYTKTLFASIKQALDER
jgi:hypothetical protein